MKNKKDEKTMVMICYDFQFPHIMDRDEGKFVCGGPYWTEWVKRIFRQWSDHQVQDGEMSLFLQFHEGTLR